MILLVEDNPDDELLTIRAFEKNHIANQITVCRDGAEAVAWLDAATVLPQVILLDLKLPKVDGLGVLRHIRSSERLRLLPVVVLTSSREDRDLVESYSLGANSYVRKPVNYEQFLEATRQLGMYWLVLNEVPPGAH
jgi:two-component system response regulator